MLNVLLISGDYPPNQTGDANHAYFIASQMSRRGIEVHVLTSALEGVIPSPGVTVHPIMRRWSWSTLAELIWFLRSRKPDAVLLLFDQRGRMYGHHPMMTLAATLTKWLVPTVKFVAQFETVQGVNIQRLPRLTRLLWGVATWAAGLGPGPHAYGTLLRDSDHVIVLSEAHRSELTKEFPALAAKSSLIPPPPIMTFCEGDDAAVRARGRTALGVQPGDFLFAFFGYVYGDKGIDTLLRALRVVAGRRPEVKLVIIGGYSQDRFNRGATAGNRQYWDEMQRLCRDLGIADRVIWTGECRPTEDLASLYLRASDTCVLPFNQGIHLNNSSFAAAAAHGLAVIATRCPDSDPQFRDRENVWLCPPGDPDGLAAAMDALVQNAGLRERLRRGVSELAKEWFSWDRAIEKILFTFGWPPGSGDHTGMAQAISIRSPCQT